ncbi:MAG TPA: glycoside hydrolase family 30 beta sandwich domain-containing protein [Terriglobales bacterium]|nr:glycoside hydrolase family 30 beta sandwich domain-containing protein [Terriglobales bacterium]
MLEHTRRDFLRLSAAGLAAGATAEALPAWGSPGLGSLRSANSGTGEITVRVTDEKRRFASAPALEWRQKSSSRSAEMIALSPEKKFQEILGFGAAFTDASCYMFSQLSAETREQLFHELFHPSEMGLNVCRTCVGASDYSTELYSFDEGEPDPDLKRFSIDHDRKYFLPALRQARKANPDLFLFSSPWSPPGWMKAGGSMLGGSMREKYFASYAHYFLKFLQAYAGEGVSIQAVTSQNEVDTDQDGRMPACLWGQEYEIGFVKNHLGPVLRANNIPTKIWLLDHNYNLWGRAICELDDPDLRKYANAVAWHGYVGGAEMMSKVHDAHPDAEMHWTEGGPDITSPRYATDWADWGHTFTDALRNWCQSLTGWNLALDEKGRPNIGPFPCGGLVTIHSQTKEITRSGQYWAFAHFSRLIRRGARRFDSQGMVPEVAHVACENPDGQKVLVLTNTAAARSVVLQMGGWVADVPLAADCVTTLAWM